MASSFSRGSVFRAAVVLIPLLEFLGGLMARVSGTTEANPWYNRLTLPLLQPPGYVFGIAWSILYALIGLAAAIIWAHRRAPGRNAALGWFGAQLVLNLAWSPLYFMFHQILPAFGLILVILAVSIVTTFRFGKISRTAAWLMLPYLVWLAFASALNIRIWQLNPDASPPVSALFAQ